MGFIQRWLQRRRERAQMVPRRRELEAELARVCGHAVRLVPAATKGGYDEIYYAQQGKRRFAVVRVNSPFKRQDDPIGELDAGVPLGPTERLEREWFAYSRLGPLGLSPKPIWRAEGVVCCSWLPWDRASDLLKKPGERFWILMERIMPAISRMHTSGVTHLDLNLGNVLVEPGGKGVVFIDFEFGPQAWVTPGQQMGFDYLRVIDNCIKRRRGGTQMLSDIDRLVQLLEANVSEEARAAELAFSLEKLQLLAEQPELCEKLRKVFREL